MKGIMLDQTSRNLTPAEEAARRAARAIADPDVRVTSDGRFVKELRPDPARRTPSVVREIMRTPEDIID